MGRKLVSLCVEKMWQNTMVITVGGHKCTSGLILLLRLEVARHRIDTALNYEAFAQKTAKNTRGKGR